MVLNLKLKVLGIQADLFVRLGYLTGRGVVVGVGDSGRVQVLLEADLLQGDYLHSNVRFGVSSRLGYLEGVVDDWRVVAGPGLILLLALGLVWKLIGLIRCKTVVDCSPGFSSSPVPGEVWTSLGICPSLQLPPGPWGLAQCR